MPKPSSRSSAPAFPPFTCPAWPSCLCDEARPLSPSPHFPFRDTNAKLHRKVEDLEDVRNVMAVLKEVREKESEIDNLIGPIEEMYGLLMRYEVRVPKEETTMVSDLRYAWKKLKRVATEVSDNLTRLQVGAVRGRRRRQGRGREAARGEQREVGRYRRGDDDGRGAMDKAAAADGLNWCDRRCPSPAPMPHNKDNVTPRVLCCT